MLRGFFEVIQDHFWGKTTTSKNNSLVYSHQYIMLGRSKLYYIFKETENYQHFRYRTSKHIYEVWEQQGKVAGNAMQVIKKLDRHFFH